MFIARLGRLIDRSPRQLYYFLRRKLLQQEGLHHFDDKHPCVFVLSTGRVGTQTLAALFGLAPNVFAYHEPKPYLYGLSKLSYQFSDDVRIRTVLAETFLVARKEIMNYSLACHRGYVETSPQVTFLAPAILEAIPNVRFIHIVRDPRDVVRSGMRRRWYDGNSYDKTRIEPHPDSEAGRQWGAYNTFQKNLWLWTETNRWILDFSASVANRVLLVQAEDVFSAYEASLRELFAFIGAPMPSEQRIARVLGKKLNAQKAGTFSKHSDWSEIMYNDLLTIAGKTAEMLGYKL